MAANILEGWIFQKIKMFGWYNFETTVLSKNVTNRDSLELYVPPSNCSKRVKSEGDQSLPRGFALGLTGVSTGSLDTLLFGAKVQSYCNQRDIRMNWIRVSETRNKPENYPYLTWDNQCFVISLQMRCVSVPFPVLLIHYSFGILMKEHLGFKKGFKESLFRVHSWKDAR